MLKVPNLILRQKRKKTKVTIKFYIEVSYNLLSYWSLISEKREKSLTSYTLRRQILGFSNVNIAVVRI